MSNVLNIYLRTIHSRIYVRIEKKFWWRDVEAPVYMCFSDFEKAFDEVRHDKLIEIRQRIGIDDKYLNIIMNLYSHQQGYVTIGLDTSESMQIRHGTRQVCTLPPLLFNLYSEYILREPLRMVDVCVKVNEINISDLRYRDDIVSPPTSVE